MTVRVADRWAPLHPFDLPLPPGIAKINISMMRGEYRAAADQHHQPDRRGAYGHDALGESTRVVAVR